MYVGGTCREMTSEPPRTVASSVGSAPPLRISASSPFLALLAVSHPTGPLPLFPTAHYISPASYLTLATSVVFPSPARSRARHYFPFLPARATHARAPWTPRVPALTHQPARHSRVPQPTLRACQPTRVPHATARASAAACSTPLMAVPHSCLTHQLD